ncbi:muramidase family protein [Ferruginibacter albus]|uniref:muramidase family protein n=1 Tax=Ferruginibacter albus TaxID=2875540 RepID=UPI001CC43248|nr:LysM domain-containing protein [Ferruginibacter albus]UAY52440.1 LysM peptidoglycan-binding domain-containing protein [Ferruginibacter albus]
MKRLIIILFLLPLFAVAQTTLKVEGTSPNLYILHTVVAKENYYSIGRLYNISPKVFAPYNNLTLDKPLNLGQTIKIPLNETNFSQGTAAGDGEVLVPVYHTIKDKEGLYRVSTNYNKVPVATLKTWNKLNGEVVDNGTNLIIGYLKVKKDLSAFAAQGTTAPVATAPVKKEETSKEVPPTPKSAPVKETKKDEVVVAPQPKPEPKKEISTETVVTTPVVGKGFNGGIFKADYNKQVSGNDVASESGAGSIFKSTSGWEDGKYYCLNNTATPGTIIKITNPANGKSVYAKSLDGIPDIKQNNGLAVLVSNAAASELGVDGKFDCKLEFSK